MVLPLSSDSSIITLCGEQNQGREHLAESMHHFKAGTLILKIHISLTTCLALLYTPHSLWCVLEKQHLKDLISVDIVAF